MGDNSRKRGKQIDFIVSTGDPTDAGSNTANKKRVRSVAALKSWPERRKKISETLESSGKGQGAFLVNEKETTRPPEQRVGKEEKGKGAVAGPVRLQVSRQRTISGNEDAVVANSEWRYVEPLAGVGSLSYHDALVRVPVTGQGVPLFPPHESACQCPPCRQTRSFSAALASSTDSVVPVRKKRTADGSERAQSALLMPPLSLMASPSNGKGDPFNCYPVAYQPWFDQVLSYMMKIYGPRGWHALKITDEQGERWEWYMTQHALAEPALFYVRLLFGSGDMIRLGTLRAEIQYWLQAQAIKSINEALNDPNRSNSDALILAIGRIALHEHMYGDRYASSHVHRPAQRRMIQMRGGMEKLEIPELVKRLMRWSDRIMAVASGTERMLEDETKGFTVRETVTAIERWAPQAIQKLRSSNKISDLGDEDGRES